MECESLRSLSAEARAHARHPRNFAPLDRFDGHACVTGPCGDTMEFWFEVRDGRIEKMNFVTDGCGPSLAAGSMATCIARGLRVEEAAALAPADILQALRGLPPDHEHCAHLAAKTVKAACDDWLRRFRPDIAGPGSPVNR